MYRQRLSIEDVVKKRICTGCGTCYSVCPKKCITIEENIKEGIYLAKIDHKQCNDCGYCNNVCPQIDILARPLKDKDEFFGKEYFCFYGYSTDDNLRYEASSGGMITELSKFALQKGLVQGIIATETNKSDPLHFEGKICRSPKEVLSCKGSKYCPVPLNRILRDITYENANDSYIFIGLPCHIWGLKKFMFLNPKLNSKIGYIFGIFCSHVPTFKGTEFIINKWHLSSDRIKKICYRGKGWPGSMTIKDDYEIDIPLAVYWSRYFGNNYFTPKFCLICDDMFAVDSDISFGDAWLPEFQEEKKGMSIGIVRTERGQLLLKECKEEKKVHFEYTDRKKVEKSQENHVTFKHETLAHRKSILLGSRYKKRISIKLRLYNILVIINSWLSRQSAFKVFLTVLSPKYEEIYFRLLNKIRSNLLKKS